MGWRLDRHAEESHLIVIDTSAWVELLRETGSSTHLTLRDLIESEEELGVTEIIVAEVLAGARSGSVGLLRSRLLAYDLLALDGLSDYERAALLYRKCRAGGVTPRSLTDCLIAAPVINHGASLFHNDADFDLLAEHTDLNAWRA